MPYLLIACLGAAVLITAAGCWVIGVVKGPVADALSDLVEEFYSRSNAKARLRAQMRRTR